ncbi:MAG: hypothetical protein AAB729_00335, partial [Patescibacteria group bacterium]
MDCKACLKTLEFQRCIVCQKSALFGQTHPKCLTPQGADGLISFFNYHDEKVAQILIKGKYSFLQEVYKILGALIAKKLQSDSNFSYLISNILNPTLVPIPLHTRRKRWRGFNQAEVLCQAIANNLNLLNDGVSTFAKATADYPLVRCKST